MQSVTISRPQVLGDFACIADGLDYAATTASGLGFWTAEGIRTRTLSYRQLRDAAVHAAARLSGFGYAPGDHIGLIAETGPDFLISFYACQYAGLVACPLAAPLGLGGKSYGVLRLRRLLEAGGMDALIGPDKLVPFIQEVVVGHPADALGYGAILSAGPAGPLCPLGPDDNAYIQFSSGSTAEPKGVLITQRAVNANARGILRQGLEVVPQDRCFSWLPFYHDMGLFGFSVSPMLSQVSVDYMSPAAFARRPALWLELIGKTRSTISFAPSFAYQLASDRAAEIDPGLDLSCWRIAGVGADMIPIRVLRDFAAVMAPASFREEAFLPTYGMAEAVLGVSFARPLNPLKASSPRHSDRLFVSCGKSLPGHDILIVDDDGNELEAGTEGHVWIRGPSVMQEYFADEEATKAVRRREGYIATGDMGFKDAGDLFVTGRSKELIKSNGKSVWPQDIEWIAAEIATVGLGDVVAFERPGDASGPVVLLIKESRIAPADRTALAAKVRAAVNAGIGMVPEIFFVSSRFLPKTPSGKIARIRACQLFEEDAGHFRGRNDF